MNKYILIVIFTLYFGMSESFTQADTTLLKEIIYTLASDSFKGRYPATIGDSLATSYILKFYKKYSCKLYNKTGLQKFNILWDRLISPQNKFFIDNINFILKRDFVPATFSDTKELDTTAYFVGYGFYYKSNEIEFDHFKNTKINGWVVFFSEKNKKHNLPVRVYNDFYKCIKAKEKGANGVIIVRHDNTLPEAGKKFNIGIPVVYVTYEVFEILCNQNNINPDSIRFFSDTANIFIPIKLKSRIYGNIVLNDVYRETNNIICTKIGKDKKLKKEYIIVGAHYDHLGTGGHNTISRMPDTTAIHNGADDNASGVASLLELVRLLKNKKTKKSIMFVAFSAEEMGLIGSSFFVENSPIPIINVKAMLNLDMVGRGSDSIPTLTISGVATSAVFEKIIDSLYSINKYSFKLNKNPDGDGPSDHASFYYKNIPVLFFNTGIHIDYHTPFDDADKINYKQVKEVTDFAYNILLILANYNGEINFQKTLRKEQKISKNELKITLGIVPDVSNSYNGLKVLGVKSNSLAEKAQIQKGDIIIKINDCKVNNIYDYMECLSDLEYNKIIYIEVIRNNEIKLLSVLCDG
ncbi:MAG: M20/M25/M40 family metallo-hydrolase [Bacteroidales bacterium]|nr:M20/M25/M40 family metallo-hydrolase [Bacteroidales bacterium]